LSDDALDAPAHRQPTATTEAFGHVNWRDPDYSQQVWYKWLGHFRSMSELRMSCCGTAKGGELDFCLPRSVSDFRVSRT
jgi:hypothetical protein